jgi:hypothetical protein
LNHEGLYFFYPEGKLDGELAFLESRLETERRILTGRVLAANFAQVFAFGAVVPQDLITIYKIVLAVVVSKDIMLYIH